MLEKMSKEERDSLAEIERLKTQAEDPRKIMRIKTLLTQHPVLVEYMKLTNEGTNKLIN